MFLTLFIKICLALIYTELKATLRLSGFSPVTQKMVVPLFVSVFETYDLRPDHEPLGREMDTYLFVAAAHRFQSHLAVRQIDLDIKTAFLADKIFFLYPDRGNQEPNSRAAHIKRFAKYAGSFCEFEVPFRLDIGVKPNLHRSSMFTPCRNKPLGQRPI